MYITKTLKDLKFKIRKGTWDENVIRAVAGNNEYKIKAKRGDLVVDVGAHIGSFSIPAAKAGARVIAYEPSKESFKLLVENAKLNGVEIDARNYAIGSGRLCHLKTNRLNMGSSRLDKSGEEVEVTNLDIPERIDILKLDCEGCEYEINLPDARFIVGELHGKKSDEFIRELKRRKYRVNTWGSNAKNCKMFGAEKL